MSDRSKQTYDNKQRAERFVEQVRRVADEAQAERERELVERNHPDSINSQGHSQDQDVLNGISAEVVVFSISHEHSNGASEVHEEAADVDVPKVWVAAVIPLDLTVLQDFVSKDHRVLSVFGFFSDLPFGSIREVAMQAKKMRVRTAVAMFHDVNITNFMELNSNIEVLEENVSPGCVRGLHHPKRGASEDELVIPVGQIVSFHEVTNVIQQSEVHTTEQQHIAARSGIGTTFGKTTMNFHEGVSLVMSARNEN